MSDQAANDAPASTGSHDDESTTTSSHAGEEAPRQRLAAWLTAYDRKIFLKVKVEGRVSHGLHIFAVPVSVVAVFCGDNSRASICVQSRRVALLVRDINDAVPKLS